MTDQSKAEDEQEGAEQSETPALPIEGQNNSASKSAGTANSPSKSKKKPTLSALGELNTSERVTAFLAGCSLIVALGSLAVAFMTWRTAADTRDIKKAVSGLATLASETKRQADALGSQVKAAGLQDKIMTSELGEMKTQTADLASEAKGVEAQIGISTSQTALMQNEQRPWIKVMPVVDGGMLGGLQWFDGTGYMSFSDIVTNVGRSPAFNVQTRIEQLPTGATIPNIIIAEKKVCEKAARGILQPGQGVTLFPGETDDNPEGAHIRWAIDIILRPERLSTYSLS